MKTGVIDRPNESPPRGKPSTAKAWLRAIELTSGIESDPQRLFADIVEDRAARQSDHPALTSDGETLGYAGLVERINRYARWALATGIKRGDTVCLIMPTRPDYIAAWLGISRVGGVAALINTRLVGQSLAHCINVAKAAHVILAGELAEMFETARPHLARAPRIWTDTSLGAVLAQLDGGPLSSAERRDVTIDDRALLIYTSGTTGLPKAASISHRRILNWGGWFAGLTDARPDDRLYNCLPLHHSVGGVVAPCSMLFAGASLALAGKFSAREFWGDLVRFDCTLFQYIGELCRYLLQAPVSGFETRHRLRLALGNGLRADIWEEFRVRFAIPRILEFYAATEGNFSLYNVEGKVGAIGRIPPLLAHRFPAAIVKVDSENGAPLRDENGLCMACARNEVGEAIGRIGNADEGGGRFEGYTDQAETESKVLRDVFARGDAWFRSGDLMRRDEQGFFHFVDRVGDTFRWKGENVATGEVSDAIRECEGVLDATTYGVEIPGNDGRAGMAAIVIAEDFDFRHLASHLARRLPAYAHPLFLRISASLETTETFKQKKQILMREGFDPAAVGEALYYRDHKSGDYLPLDAEVHARIANGAIRF
ncbi:MAG: long-chain-acyl-CoA synthetase [Bradyrhizobium sp.]|nr:long-chain-acyl-CoA synthetase [Bradyrhizobium sp.]